MRDMVIEQPKRNRGERRDKAPRSIPLINEVITREKRKSQDYGMAHARREAAASRTSGTSASDPVVPTPSRSAADAQTEFQNLRSLLKTKIGELSSLSAWNPWNWSKRSRLKSEIDEAEKKMKGIKKEQKKAGKIQKARDINQLAYDIKEDRLYTKERASNWNNTLAQTKSDRVGTYGDDRISANRTVEDIRREKKKEKIAARKERLAKAKGLPVHKYLPILAREKSTDPATWKKIGAVIGYGAVGIGIGTLVAGPLGVAAFGAKTVAAAMAGGGITSGLVAGGKHGLEYVRGKTGKDDRWYKKVAFASVLGALTGGFVASETGQATVGYVKEFFGGSSASAAEAVNNILPEPRAETGGPIDTDLDTEKGRSDQGFTSELKGDREDIPYKPDVEEVKEQTPEPVSEIKADPEALTLPKDQTILQSANNFQPHYDQRIPQSPEAFQPHLDQYLPQSVENLQPTYESGFIADSFTVGKGTTSVDILESVVEKNANRLGALKLEDDQVRWLAEKISFELSRMPDLAEEVGDLLNASRTGNMKQVFKSIQDGVIPVENMREFTKLIFNTFSPEKLQHFVELAAKK